jgi:lysophospholipid acyltransferase (LPLAT)-like uncharacterized protein
MRRPPEPGDGGLRGGLYGQIAISGQRLGAGRRLVYGLAAPLLAGLMRLWWRSCRVVAVTGAGHLDAVLARYPSFLPVYWHQHHLFCGQYLLSQQATRALRIGFLISPSRDGELGAAIMRRLGGHVIRGSSTRTGALAMKEYFQALMREQVSPVLNPDGPRGPRFVCKPGAVLLAQMSGRPLLPLAYAASRAWLVHWDKFVLPWPFARVAIAIGRPAKCRAARTRRAWSASSGSWSGSSTRLSGLPDRRWRRSERLIAFNGTHLACLLRAVWENPALIQRLPDGETTNAPNSLALGLRRARTAILDRPERAPGTRAGRGLHQDRGGLPEPAARERR